jgi:hypothetical protein
VRKYTFSALIAFFAPDQHFTIWADAIVGHTIRGHVLAGHGVICGWESPSPRSADPAQALKDHHPERTHDQPRAS